MKGRQVPPLADDRRIRACLKACEHISTEELEAGLVRDALEEFGFIQAGMALAADIVAQGRNPTHYVDLAGLVRHSAPISGRIEASGFAEAMNRAWEREHGQSLDALPDTFLAPLKQRRRSA